MKVAVVAPSPVPFVLGGAENLWSGLLAALNATPGVEADLIKLPSPERSFWPIVDSYRRFCGLDLDHFDLVVSTKYPAWMVAHRNHVVLLQHKLRGLYDTWPRELPVELDERWPVPATLRALLERRPTTRAALPDLFAALDELRALAAEAPPEMFSLPGPLIRALVHLFDGIGLAPHAVRRYLAIAAEVANRADYFPRGANVKVLHHPTNLATRRGRRQRSIFTASRLTRPKRIDLLVAAWRRANVAVPLRIAGDGDELARLRELAGGDPRIEFLGRITDADLADEYADALVVAFVPEREDYGLITLEAMQSGKPVLTVHDAGGVIELVRDGENGRIVPPDVDALAAAMQAFCADPAAAARMGERAAASVRHITWPHTVERLLDPRPVARNAVASATGERPVAVSSAATGTAETGPRSSDPTAGIAKGEPAAALPSRRPAVRPSHASVRPRLVVANTFAVYPPVSGGQERIFHLYRHLAETFDVDLVALSSPTPRPEVRELRPGFREWRVPTNEEFHILRTEVQAETQASAEDIVAAAFHEVVPAFGERLREQLRGAAVAIASHPYLHPALRDGWEGPLVYDAHNVEAQLKPEIFRPGSLWRSYVRRVEAACARDADLVLACSEADAETFAVVYGVPSSRLEVIANGCDLESLPWVPPERRRALKQRLGVTDTPLCVFIGSGHAPNIAGARHVLRLAREVPQACFAIIGTVGNALRGEALPSNVIVSGRVDDAEKGVWLAAGDIGLNPVDAGAGTNLKVVAYAASGLAILSTRIGLRGGLLEPDEHAWVAEVDEMGPVLDAMIAAPAVRAERTQRARERVEAVADWRVLARRVRDRLLALDVRGGWANVA